MSRTGDAAVDPTARTAYTVRDFAAATLVGAVVAGVGQALMVWAQDCEDMGCLSTALTALAAGAVLLPLLAVAGLALVRVARPVRCGLAGVGAGVVLASAANMLDAAVRGLSPGSQPSPTWLMLLAGALSALAGVVVAGAGFSRTTRIGVLLGLGLVLALATVPVSGR